MNVFQTVRNRMRPRLCENSGCGRQDLALYRHLRRAENNLYAARERLAAMMVSYKNAAAEHMRAVQAQEDSTSQVAAGGHNGAERDKPQLQTAVSHQHDCARRLREFQEQIDLLTHDVSRLETEYQSAQMNVRRYFYLESCPGSVQENEAVPGQPAQ